MIILGVSALYHDSAAAVIRDGEIIAAAQEERFSRKKHDSRVPVNAIRYCLEAADIDRGGKVDVLAFYDKPITKFTRLLTTFAQTAPSGFKTFSMAVPAWLREKGWVPLAIERVVRKTGVRVGEFAFPEHHASHAASAFFPSPFEEAAILTADGVGEWTCSSISVGEGNRLRMLSEQRFPHSLGLLYSAFTYFAGFKVNSGEYKLMGLAPYGTPKYVDAIKEHLIRIREDGSVWLDMDYFGYLDGLTMTNARFARLFGGPARRPESEISQREMDLAASIQVVTEEAVLKMARYARAVTGKCYLCMAGGVALNCVANGKILAEGIFDDIWIQPASGDAGGSLGAALYIWHQTMGRERKVSPGKDSMAASALGPSYSAAQIKAFLDGNGIPYRELRGADRDAFLAKALAEERVLGVCQGRMEFGPRSLGFRSIIADARSKKMQSFLNLSTKFRESFRPFAPIVLKEDVADYFEVVRESPYMLLVADVKRERRVPLRGDENSLSLTEWVNRPRSDIPAVTHVDYSARVQTVDRERNPRIHALLTEFKRLTGCSVLVNTSFNVRSEPIVCTPEDAYCCFMRTGIDVLALEDFILEKKDQPAWVETENWQEEFGLD
jgi:carbamoyltransferase